VSDASVSYASRDRARVPPLAAADELSGLAGAIDDALRAAFQAQPKAPAVLKQ
jgi:hypothetical protein